MLQPAHEGGSGQNKQAGPQREPVDKLHLPPPAAISAKQSASGDLFEGDIRPFWLMDTDFVGGELMRSAKAYLTDAEKSRGGRPWNYKEIKHALQEYPKVAERTDYYKAEYYYVPQIAAYAGVQLDAESKKSLRSAENIMKKVFSAGSEEDIRSSGRDVYGLDEKMAVTVVKWLANTAELPQDRYGKQVTASKRFLDRFVNMVFTEFRGGEAMDDYMRLALGKAREVESEKELDSKQIAFVPLYTGANPMAKIAKQILPFKFHSMRPLFFTRSMAERMGLKDGEPRRFTPEGRKTAERFLEERGLLKGDIRHIIFMDCGQRGTLHEIIKPILKDRDIDSDYLVLYHSGYSGKDRQLAHGLNDEPKWSNSDRRLLWLAHMFDDGLEYKFSVPDYTLREHGGSVRPQISFVPRRWFARLTSQKLSFYGFVKSGVSVSSTGMISEDSEEWTRPLPEKTKKRSPP